MRYLMLSMRSWSLVEALVYALSSLPRLVRDALLASPIPQR